MHIKKIRNSCFLIQLILYYTVLNLAYLFHLWYVPTSRSEAKALQKPIELFLFPRESHVSFSHLSLLPLYFSIFSILFFHSLQPWRWGRKKNSLRGNNSPIVGKPIFSVVWVDMFWNSVSDQGSISFSIHQKADGCSQGMARASICDKFSRLSLTF